MTENSLITLYCIVDDFIHRFLEISTGKKNLALYYGKRGPKRRMPIADVVTLNLIRILDCTGDTSRPSIKMLRLITSHIFQISRIMRTF
jgi:hypothetical protein